VIVEILYFAGCPSHETLLLRVRELLHSVGVPAKIERRRVEDDAAAQRERFLGSPTVRVNGRDVEPGADARNDLGLKCRLYQTPAGLRSAPLDKWLLDALTEQPA
jgi:hypothetical protein